MTLFWNNDAITCNRCGLTYKTHGKISLDALFYISPNNVDEFYCRAYGRIHKFRKLFQNEENQNITNFINYMPYSPVLRFMNFTGIEIKTDCQYNAVVNLCNKIPPREYKYFIPLIDTCVAYSQWRTGFKFPNFIIGIITCVDTRLFVDLTSLDKWIMGLLPHCDIDDNFLNLITCIIYPRSDRRKFYELVCDICRGRYKNSKYFQFVIEQFYSGDVQKYHGDLWNSIKKNNINSYNMDILIILFLLLCIYQIIFLL